MKKQLLILLFICAVALNAIGQEKLYVFHPTVMDYLALQDRLSDEMKGVAVTVFARYNTFVERVENDRPNGIITKKLLVIKKLNDYNIQLTGVQNGETVTKYVLLSTGKQLEVESVNKNTVIGVTDIMGRKKMKEFLSEFFPVMPRFKRIPKVADLLSLLSFNAVNGIMVEKVYVEYFTATSELVFFSTPLASSDNGIVVFAENEGSPKISKILKRNDKKVCDLFYIDQWK